MGINPQMDNQIKETVVMYRTARDAIGELGRSCRSGKVPRD
jgi:hypothetical protein